MYYGLTNYYQNHRRYVKSRDDEQLLGHLSQTPSSDCDPFAYDPESRKPIAPCGAIANSLFNGANCLSAKSIALQLTLIPSRHSDPHAGGQRDQAAEDGNCLAVGQAGKVPQPGGQPQRLPRGLCQANFLAKGIGRVGPGESGKQRLPERGSDRVDAHRRSAQLPKTISPAGPDEYQLC